jgi:hypothetical protein
MKSRTIAVIASLAALSVAATPVAAVAATSHHGAKIESRSDLSRDASGIKHVDRSPDGKQVDRSVDTRDR